MPSVVWLLVVVFAAMVCITTLLLLLVHREDPDALQSIVFPERPSQTPSPSTAPLPSPSPLPSPLQMAVHPPTRPTPPVSVSWQPQLVTSAESPPPLPLPPPDAASRELQQREEELLEAEARLAWKSSLGHVSAVEGQRPWRALPDAGSTLSTAWALGTSASAFASVSSDESGAWPATPPPTPAHALPRAPASPPMEGWQAAGSWAWTPGPRGPSETDPDAPDPPPWGETLSTVVALHTAAEPDAASQMTLSPSSSASSSASPSTESAIMSLVSDAASMAVSLAPATPPPTPATGVSVVGTSHVGPRPPTAEWSSTAAAAIAMAAHAPASSPLSERPSDASAGPGSAFAPALRPVGASVSWAASAGRPSPPDAETSAVSTSAFDAASSDAASGSAREAPEAQPAPPPTPPPPSRRSPRGALAAPTASTASTASTAPTASGDLARNAALASPAAGDQGAPAGFTRAMQALRGELESTERECERLRRHIAFISATRAALRRDVEAARAAPAHVDGDVGVASEGLASEGLVGEGLRRRLRLRARSLLPLPSASPLCLADPPDHQ